MNALERSAPSAQAPTGERAADADGTDRMVILEYETLSGEPIDPFLDRCRSMSIALYPNLPFLGQCPPETCD